ncbi:helix-turn-helix domain-containing protein [Erythrobacter sp.]|uniref:winged helix-turn-helix transcriptional regulator n=1 Tax=Erythrobacter sp. TaxID=1042 RepID=UPI0025BD2AAA|nr:helix-turn-helix domain-containing protein [Erythrobacter sp.]
MHDAPQCSAVNDILARVGDKWSVRVVMALEGGSRRFNQLRREISGISQRMLTRTLRGLERDGLVSRTVTPSVPPRVDYALTALGRSLCDPVARLGNWAIANIDKVEAARATFDDETDQAR